MCMHCSYVTRLAGGNESVFVAAPPGYKENGIQLPVESKVTKLPCCEHNDVFVILLEMKTDHLVQALIQNGCYYEESTY